MLGGACSDGTAPPAADAGADLSSVACAEATCNDGLFCNGTERCAADGCVAGTPPCETSACDEVTDACGTPCIDADGDSVCAEFDCDDGNAAVYPGAAERCDPDDLDEDCNPTTYGYVDADADGANDAQCCNASASGTLICGDDCDDTRRVVNPRTSEACDDIDNDCNGLIDDLPTSLYLDCDGDGYGGATTRTGCARPATASECTPLLMNSRWITTPGDCDDTRIAVRPGATDLCNGIDDDCALPVDPPTCGCSVGAMTTCGYRPAAGAASCTAVMATCSGGSFSCPGGLLTGMEREFCNGVDDNCDGDIDEDLPAVRCWADGDRDGFAAAGAAYVDRCGCAAGQTVNDPARGADCADSNPMVYPGAPEQCNGADDNCNGTLEEGTSGCLVSVFGEYRFSRSPSDGPLVFRAWSTRPTPSAVLLMYKGLWRYPYAYTSTSDADASSPDFLGYVLTGAPAGTSRVYCGARSEVSDFLTLDARAVGMTCSGTSTVIFALAP